MQIAEKKLIERELLEEEKRLNDMMEDERRWAIKEELRKEQEEAAERLRFAKTLKEQIVENEEQRILKFERKQEESRLINLNNIAWQQDEIEKLRNKEIENAKVRQELAEGNEQLKHFKAMEQEENKIIDLRFVLPELLKSFRIIIFKIETLQSSPLYFLEKKKKDFYQIQYRFQNTKLSSTERGERG